MKSTREDKKLKKAEYPRLMLMTGPGSGQFIVLFDGPERGMVVQSDNKTICVGEYADDWSTKLFSEFHGTVTLEN